MKHWRTAFGGVCCLAGAIHAGEPGFWLVGKPAGFSLQNVLGLSGAGDLVVGFSYGSSARLYSSFEFSDTFGRVDAPSSVVLRNSVALSPNAEWLAVYSGAEAGVATRVFNRSNGQQVISARPFGYLDCGVRDLSDTGVAVGYLTFELYPGVASRRAIRVSEGGELAMLSALTGQTDLYSDAFAISADGRIVVGAVAPVAASEIGVVWTDGSPTWLRGLLDDDAFEGVDARAVSTDGKYIAGSALASRPDVTWPTRHASLWRSPTEVVDLAHGTSFTSEAFALADDGATAVGYMDIFDPAVGHQRWTAMIWTAATGLLTLSDYLASRGVETPMGIQLAVAQHISKDGLTIAGLALDSADESTTVGFVVRLPPPPCIADFNADGGIDGSDIEPFFAAWEGGEPAADVNQDGGVDMGDVQTFFTQWESGACGR